MITASDCCAGETGQRDGGSQPGIAARQDQAVAEHKAVEAVELDSGLQGSAIVASARLLEAGSSVVNGEDERENGGQQDDRVAVGSEEEEDGSGRLAADAAQQSLHGECLERG